MPEVIETPQEQIEKVSDSIQTPIALNSYIRVLVSNAEMDLAEGDGRWPSILDEHQISSDIREAIGSSKDEVEGEKLFTNLKRFADQFKNLENKTKEDLLALRDDIYAEIKDELGDFYRNSVTKYFMSEGGMDVEISGNINTDSGMQMTLDKYTYSVFGNEEGNKISHIEKDGKTFKFNQDAYFTDSIQFIVNWNRQEDMISDFNKTAPAEYRFNWKKVDDINLIQPGLWKFEQNGKAYMITSRDVLIKDGDDIVNPFNLDEKINIEDDGQIKITYKTDEKEAVRRITGTRDYLVNNHINENGNRVKRKSVIDYSDNQESVRLYISNENGDDRLIESSRHYKMYEEKYQLDRDFQNNEHILTFEDKTTVELADINPKLSQEEKERQADEYLNKLAQKLNTPEKLAIFMKSFMKYTHDSPYKNDPLAEGIDDDNFHGDYWQSPIETVLRQKEGVMMGDCDDYAFFAREILIRQKNVVFVHTLGVPKHATCLWVTKTKTGYQACTIGTFGLDKQDGETIDEAYLKVVSKFENPGLGLDEGVKIDEGDKNITILFNNIKGSRDYIDIPKTWLDSESQQGVVFFNLTRSIDLKKYDEVVKYAEELSQLSYNHEQWCENLMLDANVKLGNYQDVFDKIENSWFGRVQLIEMLFESDFAILNDILESKHFSQKLLTSFVDEVSDKVFRNSEKIDHKIIKDFNEKIQKLDYVDQNTKDNCVRSYGAYLRSNGKYDEAYDFVTSNLDYDLLDIRNLLPHLDLEIVLKEVPQDIRKISSYDYVDFFQIFLKAKHPFAKELLMAINGSLLYDEMSDGEINFMLDFYEKIGDKEHLLALHKNRVAKFEWQIEQHGRKYYGELVKFGSDEFWEIAAEKYFVELGTSYEALDLNDNLTSLKDGREKYMKNNEYYEGIKNNPENTLEKLYAYVELSDDYKQKDKYVVQKCNTDFPTKYVEDARFYGNEELGKNKIPIISITKNTDPEGYHWAQVSPHVKYDAIEGRLGGDWIRIKKEKVKINRIK